MENCYIIEADPAISDETAYHIAADNLESRQRVAQNIVSLMRGAVISGHMPEEEAVAMAGTLLIENRIARKHQRQFESLLHNGISNSATLDNYAARMDDRDAAQQLREEAEETADFINALEGNTFSENISVLDKNGCEAFFGERGLRTVAWKPGRALEEDGAESGKEVRDNAVVDMHEVVTVDNPVGPGTVPYVRPFRHMAVGRKDGDVFKPRVVRLDRI